MGSVPHFLGEKNSGLWENWIAVLLLIALIFVTFANTFNLGGFPLDSRLILVDSRVHAFSLHNLKLIFGNEYWWAEGSGSGIYRPITTLTYMLNYAVFGNGAHATGYHLFNCAVHTVNSLLVFFLFLGITGRRVAAVFIAAIFAVHPVNVEAVTNIAGRADLLAALSVLFCLYCHARGRGERGLKKGLWLTALALSGAFGVFCKESAVITMPLLVIYDLAFRRQEGNGKVKTGGWTLEPGYLALLPSLLLFFLARHLVLGDIDLKAIPFIDNPLVAADFWSARLTAIKILGRNIALLFWPGHLSIDYSYNQIPLVNWPFSGWADWQAMASLLLLVSAVGAAVWSYRRGRMLFFLVLFFLVAWLPTANILPRPGAPIFAKESWLIGTNMAERFMYLPSIPFAACLVLFLYRAAERLRQMAGGSKGGRFHCLIGPAVTVVLSIIIVALALGTFKRNLDWENQLTLTSHDVMEASASLKLPSMLVEALYRNPPVGAGLERVIERAQREATTAGDVYSPLMTVLGVYYLRKGDLSSGWDREGAGEAGTLGRPLYLKAVATLQRAVSLLMGTNGDNSTGQKIALRDGAEHLLWLEKVETLYAFGLSLSRLGRNAEALEIFRLMRGMAPFDYSVYFRMAELYELMGDFEHAAVALHQLMVLNNRDQKTGNALVRIYRKIQGGKAALVHDKALTAIDYANPLAHRLVCEANLDLVEVFLRADNPATAWEIMQGSLRVFNCERGMYDYLMPQGR